ncbi:MAG: non-ribosomal peptide synthetase, partial [Gemmatimonadaceae bacterium]
GAAYVPLDPEFPAARLAYMLEDAGVRVIVSQRSISARLPVGDRKVIWLDDLERDALFDEAPKSAATFDDRAYVIYTSGSTGLPKGVEVRQSNVVNFLNAMRERPGIDPGDVLVAVTTPSFDIAVLELFLPLVTGATVVIAPSDTVMDGAKLGALLRESGATMMQATPATWRALLDAGWRGQSGLKALCGGEALAPELARKLLPLVGELWNMYGPTETTVWSTCARITDAGGIVPIGSPIANTVFRVVDRRGQQVPVGVPGELLLGGAGVASGYLGRSELTEQRFVSDPTGQASGMRFYRTGDLARLRPDGQLEHLGRLDDQVKVQGFRIELGEVESVLAALPAITEAVVSVYSDEEGDARLVAWVVYRPGEQLTGSEVRRYLRHQLPAYMVPGLIVQLDAVPRTNNGKVNRRALPNPLGGRDSRNEYQAPATAMERLVAQAWSALLPVSRVGRTDNFFELGGHSLLSMRAVAAIEQQTGVHLDARLMFFQTVEQIAANLERRVSSAVQS